MTDLHVHRKVVAENYEIFSLRPPFSFFDFADKNFGSSESIRRIFSLSRSFDAEALVLETISPVGIIAEENEDILARYPKYECFGLCRLSFWKSSFPNEGIEAFSDDDLIGYAIVKNDAIKVRLDGACFDGWHIFESVFQKYPHPNNCTPNRQTYSLSILGKDFHVKGLLYCQQNSFNKSCAQVAMRSLLSRSLPEGDVSYRELNALAELENPGFDPRRGLSVQQIRRILEEKGILYSDVDYSIDKITSEQLRVDLPYQKYAYAGLESGGGALVGFRFESSRGQESGHIIPIYGHTFNKDTWAPDANFAYFKIGNNLGYIPSESWTSSFIAHDDNFGPNFCIPRLYIKNDNVDYVLEVFRQGITYSGVLAEAMAINIAYPLLEGLPKDSNGWLKRLAQGLSAQRIVFRAQALTVKEYVEHLRQLVDWEGNNENVDLCDFLDQELPKFLWVVEVSTPHLFPANKRKLGEFVFSGRGEVTNTDGSLNNDLFVLARLPEWYVLGGDLDSNGIPEFTKIPSQIVSHTSLFGC